MTKSKNYGFNLPSRDTDDIADINQIAENFRIIDEELHNLSEKSRNEPDGEINLLDSEHITKWNIVRESDNSDTPADTEYNHYAGAVDMTGQGIEGVTGMLVQLSTNSYTTNWTDFVYDGTVDLGTNFSMLVTAFIKNYLSSIKIPNDNSYVEIQLGMLSIILVRAVSDMASGEDFDKLRLWLFAGGNPVTQTDVITADWNTTDYPTTTLYDGHPAYKTPLHDPHSSVMAYIREQCPAQNGHIHAIEQTTCFLEEFGWKDFTIKVRNGVLSVLDANGNPFKFMDVNGEYTVEEIDMFSYEAVTTDMFYNITPKVRSYHDTNVALYNPQAVVRMELKVDDKDYSAEIIGKLSRQIFELNQKVEALSGATSN